MPSRDKTKPLSMTSMPEFLVSASWMTQSHGMTWMSKTIHAPNAEEARLAMEHHVTKDKRLKYLGKLDITVYE